MAKTKEFDASDVVDEAHGNKAFEKAFDYVADGLSMQAEDGLSDFISDGIDDLIAVLKKQKDFKHINDQQWKKVRGVLDEELREIAKDADDDLNSDDDIDEFDEED